MSSKYRVFNVVAAGAAAAVALFGSAAPANAATINLVDLGGVTGSQSELGFKIAADFWAKTLTNNVTVNLGVRYSALGSGIIGQTSSTKYGVAISDVEAAIAANAQTELDQGLVMPGFVGTANVSPFGTVGTIGMVRNAPLGTGQLSTTKIYDADNTKDNATVAGTRANLKALGYELPTATTDASVTFSTAFNFDFDPTDGIATGKMDFIGVAIHEIGHALGFTSGVDTYDAYLPAGPNGAVTGVNWDANTVGNILDLFRYSNDPTNVAPGLGPVIDWSVGTAAYFSINGGLTSFNGNSLMSTGQYNGDGRQASHFKDTPSPAGCDGFAQIGVMDPTFCYGEMGVIKANDLAAFDAIGWNVNVNVMDHPLYSRTTNQIYRSYFGAAVPEPASWAMMIGGFGMIGAAMRRRAIRLARA